MLRQHELCLFKDWQEWIGSLAYNLTNQSRRRHGLIQAIQDYNAQASNSKLKASVCSEFVLQVRQWVLRTICGLKSQADRNRKFKYFLQLAKTSLEVNNFNLSYQIFSALR